MLTLRGLTIPSSSTHSLIAITERLFLLFALMQTALLAASKSPIFFHAFSRVFWLVVSIIIRLWRKMPFSRRLNIAEHLFRFCSTAPLMLTLSTSNQSACHFRNRKDFRLSKVVERFHRLFCLLFRQALNSYPTQFSICPHRLQ